ncbi:MAG: flagellar biosynthetic protein FliR [Zetaproteobacteria bacterium]|nr:flagellar biosynthetic protein FliR [Zetaproteobacteria bacterium]
MFILNQFLDAQTILFALGVFLRISVMVLMFPVMGHKLVPAPVKLGLIALLTIIVVPIAPRTVELAEFDPVYLGLIVVKEVLLGALVGLMASIVFATAHFAGQLMSINMGLSMATTVDPTMGSSVSVTGQMINMLAFMAWLMSGAHHMMLGALIDSFTWLPIGGEWGVTAGWPGLSEAMGYMFLTALKLSAPILLLMLFVNAALGVLGRAVPQIQVFFVGLPLGLGLGILVFSLALPAIYSVMSERFGQLLLLYTPLFQLLGK